MAALWDDNEASLEGVTQKDLGWRFTVFLGNLLNRLECHWGGDGVAETRARKS